MSSALFSPYRLAGLELANRLVVSPMCQYSADDGCANDWHLMHLGMLANSGASLVVVEATHVERHGRITHGCLGLYNDDNEAALARVMAVGAARGLRQIRHPDRAFRPQGLGAEALGRHRSAARRRRSVADHRCLADPVRAELANAARGDRGRHGARAAGFRLGRQARAAHRLRRDRAAHGARLSGARLHVAGLQQAHRPVRRRAGKPPALSAVDCARGARHRAEGHPARRPHHRQRLASRWADGRRRRRHRQGASRPKASTSSASRRAASPPTPATRPSPATTCRSPRA